MFVNLYLVLFATLFLSVALLVRRAIFYKNYPSAPGPWLARWTHVWYLGKILEGKFEKWEVDMHATQGKIVRVTPQMYSIDDPDAARQLYGISTTMSKTNWYNAWGDPNIVNHNLFSTTDRKFHGAMRKKMASLYSMTSIKSYEPFVENCISILLEHFDKFAANGETPDLQRWMQYYAFDVIGEITFGKRVGFLEAGGKDVNDIIKGLDGAVGFSTMFGVDPTLLPVWFAMFGNPMRGLLNFTKRSQEARTASKEKVGATTQSFADKLEISRKDSPDDYKTYHMDAALVSNVGAGSDTISISLTAALWYTITDDRVYAKLRGEISAALSRGEVSSPITFDEAANLQYLHLVLKEALRIHPATGLPMWRHVAEPGATIAGKFFPGGAIVGINAWVAGRNQSVFGPDADAFRPERWDPKCTPRGKLTQMEQYYIPWGMGTRTCVGKNIAILEMVKLIPELIRRYDFEPLTKELNYRNVWFVKQKDIKMRLRLRKE